VLPRGIWGGVYIGRTSNLQCMDSQPILTQNELESMISRLDLAIRGYSSLGFQKSTRLETGLTMIAIGPMA
jgi:hypothetical protein